MKAVAFEHTILSEIIILIMFIGIAFCDHVTFILCEKTGGLCEGKYIILEDMRHRGDMLVNDVAGGMIVGSNIRGPV